MTFGVTSCSEKKTDDAVKSYTYWADAPPQNDLKVIHGKYWQSANFTKEYIVYLELAASSTWKEDFIKQNHLVLSKDELSIPTDAPSWFRFQKTIRVWKQNENNQSQYIEDLQTGHWFIFEQQL
jgi:hypothetical protein